MPADVLDAFDDLPISLSVRIIGSDERPVSFEAVRRCALRLGVAKRDARGQMVLPRWVVDQFRKNYQSFGYLAPRGARSLTTLREGAA